MIDGEHRNKKFNKQTICFFLRSLFLIPQHSVSLVNCRELTIYGSKSTILALASEKDIDNVKSLWNGLSRRLTDSRKDVTCLLNPSFASAKHHAMLAKNITHAREIVRDHFTVSLTGLCNMLRGYSI